jgi:undecaprenyl-diphosphatase
MLFSLWQVVVLAVVQGITEFLPISSDGHLVVIAPLLFGRGSGPPNMMDLTIALHLGTLGSILVFYRRRVAELLTNDRRVLGLICLGTVPAVALVLACKLLFEPWFEPVLQSRLLAGLMLPVTGLALLWSQSWSGKRDYRDLTWLESLLIGLAQATAILPGLSRSGTTITAGLGLGLSRMSAATYSFLLAIPALAGAGVYEGFSLLKDNNPLSAPPAYLAVGAIVSFFVGLGALKALSRMLERGRLHYLGWYCIALGAAVTIWQLLSR